MSAQDFGVYANSVGRFLVEEHGFNFAKRRYIRSDNLLRSVWFVPLNATQESYRFDVLLDLGVPGLSEFGPRKQVWIVRAHAQQIPFADPTYPRAEFVLVRDACGQPKASDVDRVIRRLCDEYLLRYQNPVDLYRLVYESALAFAKNGMTVNDEFKRLRLDPWNAVRRLELAAVYAAFLGLEHDVDAILAQAREFATANRVDYAIPEIESGVETARRVRPS